MTWLIVLDVMKLFVLLAIFGKLGDIVLAVKELKP